MKFIGATNVSTPNVQGTYTYPPNGVVKVLLTAGQSSPTGQELVVGTPYIISQLGGEINEATIINGESKTPLQIVFVDTLPSVLENSKAYICTKEGYRSTFYLSTMHLSSTFEYRIAASSSIVSTDMLDAMFPVGEIKSLAFRVDNNPYLKPCDGTVGLLRVQEYPEYTAAVLKAGILDIVGGDGISTIGVPNLTNVFPMWIGNIVDLRALIPNTKDLLVGGKFEISTMAKLGFNTLPSSSSINQPNNRNGKKNDSAGVTGPRPNEGVNTGTSSIPALSPNFDSPNILDPAKVQISDNVIAPPFAPMYPHILIR